MEHRAPAKVLDGLTAPQLEAVTSLAAPLCVIAGAGSGKTRVLTRRVARRVLDGSADAERTLVLTFTRKAAGELKARLSRLGVAPTVNAGTFHAIAYAQLRRHWRDQGKPQLSVLDSPARIISRLMAQRSGNTPDPGLVSAVCNEISWARARILGPDQYRQEAEHSGRESAEPGLVAELYDSYSTTKRRRGLVDLDDLVESCAQLLEDDAVFGDAQRWLYRHLFVDELQDLNPAQWRLVRGWLGERDDLFVVGDPLQAVYSWNGADPDLLNRIEEVIPGTTVLRLDDNHRCAASVVEVARAVISSLAGSAELTSANEDTTGRVDIREFDDDISESAALAMWLRERHPPGRSWSSLAVLARTNARLDPVARGLAQAGIPYIRREQTRNESETSALSALRAMPSGTPVRQALATLAAEHADIDWLASEVDSLCAEAPEADVGQLLSIRASLAGPDGRDSAAVTTDAVQLLTFHRAKGLEWSGVAVVGLEAGMVPIAHAIRSEALDEERRLLYVALTRAERDLWCSFARHRNVRDRNWNCEPSPYLSAMRLAATAVPNPDPVSPSVHIEQLRSRLAIAR